MINISESSDFSLLLWEIISPSCIFNPYFFLWHKRGKLPKGWILTALALFCLYWWELSVQKRKLSCFVNDNEYLGMQMSMWVLCCWNRENRMFCHSELSRNCLPGKRNQHTNKWQFLGDYRVITTRFCTSQTELPLLNNTTPFWKAIWFDVPPLQFREPCIYACYPHKWAGVFEKYFLQISSWAQHSNEADFRDLMTHILCYHFHVGKTFVALKPEVGSANSSTCAMPKSCSRESGCHENSAKRKETKHKHHRTKAVKIIEVNVV